MSQLDAKIAILSQKYLPIARNLLAEVIRIPADYVDRPVEEGGDPLCGLSNHEGPRLEYLKKMIVEIGAVASPDDVGYDEYGNLVWTVEDPDDPTPRAERKIIYLDGHTDTVNALRSQWREKTGGGLDAYRGLVNADQLDRDFLRGELGYLPPDDEWKHLLFGRGAADQLGGVVAQVMATKIMRELIPDGSLRGAIVRSYGTVTEEDNDGGGPRYLMDRVLPGAAPDLVPDAVILTEGTGDAQKGSLGIYRGQRGRMQIEVDVRGRSCHGSMPWEGKNPLEYGGAIIDEAAAAYREGRGFLDNEFLGGGTRTASWSRLDTPSDCAVPERFVFRFDRRLTIGETPEQAVADVEALAAIGRARADGLAVQVSVPRYDQLTWRGYNPDNPQIYMGWVTPEDHPLVQAAAEAYRRVVSPHLDGGGNLLSNPRVDRWIFSTDGVGFPIPEGDTRIDHAGKGWVVSGAVKHPAMIGIGPGIEQNTHKIGEVVDTRELRHAISVIARIPSLLAQGA